MPAEDNVKISLVMARLVVILLLVPGVCFSQEEPKPGEPGDQTAAEKADGDKDKEKDKEKEKAEDSEPKPYDKVIIAQAKSRPGIFSVHQVKQKWYFEIPASELNRDFLWVTRLVSGPNGINPAGENYTEMIVRWERRENKIILRQVKYSTFAEPREPVFRGVARASIGAVLAVLKVQAWGEHEAAVVDVTSLFRNGSLGELAGAKLLNGTGVDAARSWIDRIATFPENIEVEVTNTFRDGGPGPAITLGGTAVVPPKASKGAIIHYSMIRLPEVPMRPRLYDDRVGFLWHEQQDVGIGDRKVRRTKLIARWRLEKQYPSLAVSEPVKPIVYYIDPATPLRWVPYLKRAVEQWQGAFEEAGFRNAIVAREAPTPEQDPEWSVDDARYSVIRWVAAPEENALGPHIADPRSGEILNAPVTIYHDLLGLLSDTYLTQVGPLDPRARKLPLPEELAGELLEYAVAHEIGHSIGLQHNFISSSTYTIAQIRDREWVHRMGHCPSIMDYARFNYVAQPEDNLDPHDLIPRVGPYDRWAIAWGYRPIPQAGNSEEEKPTLDGWAREQEKTPWLRFSPPVQGIDPGDQVEAIGDNDAVVASTLGLLNLKRVVEMIPSALPGDAGESYRGLQRLFQQTTRQWVQESNHVLQIVGAYYGQAKHVGQQGPVWTPVPRERQKAALKWYLENTLTEQSFMHPQQVTSRLFPSYGWVEYLTAIQGRICLSQVMSPIVLMRLQDQQTTYARDVYTPVEFLDDVRNFIFRDMSRTGSVKIDVYRRNLQWNYVFTAGNQAAGRFVFQFPTNPNAPQSPLQTTNLVQAPLMREQLGRVRAMVNSALPRAADDDTRSHLLELKALLARSLDRNTVRARSEPGAGMDAVSFAPMQIGNWKDMHSGQCWNSSNAGFVLPKPAEGLPGTAEGMIEQEYFDARKTD